MKAVILCGGMGTRLREETEYKPKPLVEIGGKPILWHIMKHYSYYGIKEFVLCLGYKGFMIKDYFLDLHEKLNDFVLDLKTKEITLLNENLEDWRIIFAETGPDSMTGSRIARIRKYVQEDGEFFLNYGDCISDINLLEMYDFHKEKNKTATIAAVNPISPLGILEVGEDSIAKSFKEKPQVKDITSGGIFICSSQIFNYLSEESECVFEEKPLQNISAEGQLAVYLHKGFRKSMDTFKEAEQLNKMWRENPAWKIWKD